MRYCQNCKLIVVDEIKNCPNDTQPTLHAIDGNPVLKERYYLEKYIGQGGMGYVFGGRHAHLKTMHAIKMVLPNLVAKDPDLITRLRQEARAAVSIHHPNVVQVTDYDIAENSMHFLVMEYVDGETLHDRLAREKRLSTEKAVELMGEICAGVAAAHQSGIIHRDLKLANIMISSKGIKVLDFGIAKIKRIELLGSIVPAETIGLMGSAHCMAPEQWTGDSVDSLTDVYALGVMLYQMIAGREPFSARDMQTLFRQHLYSPPPTFAEVGVEIPLPVEAAIFRALAKDREKRTQSAEDFIADLRQAMGTSNTMINRHAELLAQSSSVHFLTNPPAAKVFIDDLEIGDTDTAGWLLVDSVRNGEHRVRVVREGYYDWECRLECHGEPREILVKMEVMKFSSPAPSSLLYHGLPKDGTSIDNYGRAPLGDQSLAGGSLSNYKSVPTLSNGRTANHEVRMKWAKMALGAGVYILVVCAVAAIVLVQIRSGSGASAGGPPTAAIASEADSLDAPLEQPKTNENPEAENPASSTEAPPDLSLTKIEKSEPLVDKPKPAVTPVFNHKQKPESAFLRQPAKSEKVEKAKKVVDSKCIYSGNC